MSLIVTGAAGGLASLVALFVAALVVAAGIKVVLAGASTAEWLWRLVARRVKS